MTNLVPKGKYAIYNSVFHPMCYETYCSSKSLTIKINGLYVVCPRYGGNVKVEGYDGYLSCPDYNLICTGTVFCNDIFDCINKKSLVKNDTFDYDYTSLTNVQNEELRNTQILEGKELANDGKCPKDSITCKVETNNNEKDSRNQKSFSQFFTNKSIILLLLIKLYFII